MTTGSDRDRWRGRPGHARALRTAVLIAPLVVSVGVVAAGSRLWRAPGTGAAGLGRMGALVVLAMLAAAVTERAARRLLPLSILLELSMLFPERAPSRLAVARRAKSAATSPQSLLESGDEDAAGAAFRILALMSALAAHDRRTRGHAERVRAFTDLLAVRMDLPRADRDKLRWAALLHDIGKLGVEARTLNKPSKLDRGEWESIKRHPAEGERLAGPLLEWLGEWGKAIVEHHERFDGKGYPMGLSGNRISPAGRMVGVVDAYETMTAARTYKKALATREARAELARCAGTQFDPAVVRAFLAISLPRLLWASGPLSFVVQLPFLRFIQEAGLRVASVSSSVAATTTAVAGAAVMVLPAVSVPGVVAREGGQARAAASPRQSGGASPATQQSASATSTAIGRSRGSPPATMPNKKTGDDSASSGARAAPATPAVSMPAPAPADPPDIAVAAAAAAPQEPAPAATSAPTVGAADEQPVAAAPGAADAAHESSAPGKAAPTPTPNAAGASPRPTPAAASAAARPVPQPAATESAARAVPTPAAAPPQPATQPATPAVDGASLAAGPASAAAPEAAAPSTEPVLPSVPVLPALSSPVADVLPVPAAAAAPVASQLADPLADATTTGTGKEKGIGKGKTKAKSD